LYHTAQGGCGYYANTSPQWILGVITHINNAFVVRNERTNHFVLFVPFSSNENSKVDFLLCPKRMKRHATKESIRRE
jgi:hypothetical protein